MTDDAMEWHPTTPPSLPRPYPNSCYVPGGWPESPPAPQHASDIFARKRKRTTGQSAAKRVCNTFRTLGTYAAVPVQPVYLIIRYWRTQQRDRSRRLVRDSAQSRRIPPALRARIADAEQRVRAQQPRPAPQQTATPPESPTHEHHNLSSQGREQKHEELGNRAATSIANPETATFIPPSPSSPARTGSEDALDRARRRPGAENFREHIRCDLEDHSTTTYTDWKSQLATSTPFKMKKLNNVNRFDADYKRSLPGHSLRNSHHSHRLRSIGTKLESEDQTAGLFGGWEHEAPLGITHHQSPTPSEQMQSELDTHVTGYDLLQPFKHRTDEHSRLARSPDLHDERWSSDRVLDMFFPEEQVEMNSSTEENQLKNAPPPIRSRLNPIDERLPASPSSRTGAQNRTTDTFGQHEHKASSSVVHSHSGGDQSSTKSHRAHNITETEVKETNGHVATGIKTVDERVPPPSTPFKNLVEEVAEQDTEVSDTVAAQNQLLETPVEKMAKLNLKAIGDNDTPKATPHSGTKTTRITRYREALEKQQKSKLEQYELVAITEEWDRRVRAAVRNGIPDFLGPHDLARVVPQYAGRGQDNWLNDETINKYLELIAAHGRKADRPDQIRTHHTFNNFFYNNLRSKGADSVTRWSKRAKIGGKNLAYVEKVFVPINSGAHWTLAVVEPTQKKITHYNSMRGTATGVRACEDLLKWVAVELGKDFQEEEWSLVAVGESPQQTNSDDCGVFTITSARQIMLGLTPMSYGPAQIPVQRIRIVAELINKGLLRSSQEA